MENAKASVKSSKSRPDLKLYRVVWLRRSGIKSQQKAKEKKAAKEKAAKEKERKAAEDADEWLEGEEEEEQQDDEEWPWSWGDEWQYYGSNSGYGAHGPGS